ncbi:beta-glucosidase [Cypionkella psychrotolerans]|uniref:beta-glucosidase n=1 Tax=Cypionkella psychrotolerans TaxID=1678131 RepID=UPI0006B521CE|nr:glycoside hydrolase family 3 C-terminal domain-containing protein [Cypionkella psychrotolerans]
MAALTPADLTTYEKITLLHGRGLWRSQPIPHANIPSIIMTDGAYGLRYSTTQIDAGADTLTQFLNVAKDGMFGTTLPATCFPNANLSACSWDKDLAYQMGTALASECRAAGVHLLLGPGINLRRTPFAGRAFEYYSEDPILTADLAAAMISGLQDHGIGASLKHFACNNSEIDRTNISSDVSERALREIYLYAFERAIARCNPWTVMSAYNPLNGTQSAENPWLLTQVLRQDWGYDGLVISDWHAIKDRPASLLAGTDLDMPESPRRREALRAAITNGSVPMAALDQSTARMLLLLNRIQTANAAPPNNPTAHHQLAQNIATESLVLLQNDGTLPLPKANFRLLIIGEGATNPTIQGSGSASTRPTRVDIPLDEIRARLATTTHLPFTATLEEIATHNPDAILIFATHHSSSDGEGADRQSLSLAPDQDALIASLAQSHRIIVALTSPDAVEMPWAGDAAAILACFYPGQGGGAALARVLFGEANPCGKLTTTFPQKSADIPGHLSYPPEGLHHTYSEGIFVGYRAYDAREIAPLFPFGHGLSYTTFRYDSLTLSDDNITPTGSITAQITLTNIGHRAGKEIVQLYIRPLNPDGRRPLRELKAFGKIALNPGETGTLTLALTPRDFSHFDPTEGRFVLRGDAFLIEVAASSRDIRLTAQVQGYHQPKLPIPLLTTTSANKLLTDSRAEAVLLAVLCANLPMTKPQAQSLIDNSRTSFLGLYDTLSWYIADSLPEAALQQALDAASKP